MKISAQDIHSLLAPSECCLRVWFRAKSEQEAEAGPFEQMLMKLGRRHEAAYLATIPQFANLQLSPFQERAPQTERMMARNVRVLYQPVLKCLTTIGGVECEIVGEPDFLILENDGYVVRDVKMVRRVDEQNHPEVTAQLQFYGWLFGQVFGHPPLRLEVLNGQSKLVIVPQSTENVLRLLRKIAGLKNLPEAPYSPVGWSKCTGCGFRDRCWKESETQHDVALVLGVDQGLAIQLHKQGAPTFDLLIQKIDIKRLAALQRPWGNRMQKLGKTALAILRSAKALQTNTETVLARAAIPEHDNYVMFDLEGLPPQLDALGKVYLWGMQVCGRITGGFQPAVAGFGEAGDEQGWREFLSIAHAIFEKHGDIPFVHWSGYEKTQINEYVHRYGDPTGTAARVLKNLLDLLPVARACVVLPLNSFSLKELEKYVGFKRTQDEYGGAWSMARFIEASETEEEALRHQIMEEIIVYNKEDLAATWAVFRWLRGKQPSI